MMNDGGNYTIQHQTTQWEAKTGVWPDGFRFQRTASESPIKKTWCSRKIHRTAALPITLSTPLKHAILTSVARYHLWSNSRMRDNDED